MVDSFDSGAEPEFERLLKALRFERTDRVPNWEIGIESRSVEYLIGKRLRASVLPARDKVALSRRVGTDVIRILTPNALARVTQAEEDGTEYYVDGTIKSLEDLARFDLDAVREGWLRESTALIREGLELTRGSGLGVAADVHGPLYTSYLAGGLQDFMVAVRQDPALVVALMEFYTGYALELARLLVREGVPLAILIDDVAHTGGLLVSPSLLDEHWYPGMRAVADILAAGGIPTIFHCCGKLDRVLPYLLRLGCAAVQPIQANCNDIYAIRRQYGKQIALMGNVDITFPLSFGTPEDVRRDVLEHLERLGREGGYVLCSSHSIINSIPPENFVTMIQTVHEWRPGG
ncbi:MAG: hypothetical protein HY331_04455 [Chloroflexi bacterium]|nr:hypothetical protein [Chloroflexota bacterium]